MGKGRDTVRQKTAAISSRKRRNKIRLLGRNAKRESRQSRVLFAECARGSDSSISNRCGFDGSREKEEMGKGGSTAQKLNVA